MLLKQVRRNSLEVFSSPTYLFHAYKYTHNSGKSHTKHRRVMALNNEYKLKCKPPEILNKSKLNLTSIIQATRYYRPKVIYWYNLSRSEWIHSVLHYFLPAITVFNPQNHSYWQLCILNHRHLSSRRAPFLKKHTGSHCSQRQWGHKPLRKQAERLEVPLLWFAYL